jgi:hypothetical protein
MGALIDVDNSHGHGPARGNHRRRFQESAVGLWWWARFKLTAWFEVWGSFAPFALSVVSPPLLPLVWFHLDRKTKYFRVKTGVP